ncbi:MAG TPA: hypothetical protein VFV85_10155 [Conexibacter sp.]|nr:hypothetical protein [Conexibacter sp.]
MSRRALVAAALGATLAASPWLAPAAWAAFTAAAGASATLASYSVPAPANIRCQGLTSLTSSRIVWDAVGPPTGNTVSYVVTPPGSRAVTTTQAFYQLPALSLTPGQYAVQTQISSGWLSPATTITVSLSALGILYLCSTP